MSHIHWSERRGADQLTNPQCRIRTPPCRKNALARCTDPVHPCLRGGSSGERSHLSKVIFLLGAGASHDAKLPLMADLTTGFPEWLKTATTVDDKDRDQRLFEAAVKAVSPAGAA